MGAGGVIITTSVTGFEYRVKYMMGGDGGRPGDDVIDLGCFNRDKPDLAVKLLRQHDEV